MLGHTPMRNLTNVGCVGNASPGLKTSRYTTDRIQVSKLLQSSIVIGRVANQMTIINLCP